MFEFKKGTPESVGLKSANIAKVVRALSEANIHLHSLVLVKGDTVIFDGAFKPMTSTELHRLYSTSKSFTGIAAGLLIADGRLKLSDHIVDFFPEYDRETLHPYQLETTVEDILTMQDCHHENTYHMDFFPQELDWIDTWFKMKPEVKPGTVYEYSTECPVILGEIIYRITGHTFMDELKEKIFEPMGFSEGIDCVRTPTGLPWGGSGVLGSTYDMAKMAYLLQHDGCVNGQQLISAEYLKEAMAPKVWMAGVNKRSARVGFGYHIWSIPAKDIFFFSGMGSQSCWCYRGHDFIMAVTGDTEGEMGAGGILDGVRQYLLEPELERAKAEGTNVLPEDPEAYAELLRLGDSLTMSAMEGRHDSPLIPKVGGKTYVFKEGNQTSLKDLRIEFAENGGTVFFENKTGAHEIGFTYEGFTEQWFSEPDTATMDIGHPGGRPIHSYGTGAWLDDRSLHVTLYISDVCFGYITMMFCFEDDALTVRQRHFCEWALHQYVGMATGYQEK